MALLAFAMREISAGTAYAIWTALGAIGVIIGGDLYAVTDPIDEKGKRVRIPHLVHAGVYDGDDVVDIEGRSPADSWSQRWRANGGCMMEGSTGSVDAEEMEKFQSHKHIQIGRASCGERWCP